MRLTRRGMALWGVCGVLWVLSFTVTVWVAHPELPAPWWLAVFRGPMWAATWAGYAVSLVLHHLLADRGTMFKIAYHAGIEDGVAARGRNVPGTNVFPLQPQRRSSLP